MVIMKKSDSFAGNICNFATGFILTMWMFSASFSYGFEIEIPSSLNPVGSGARAIGMGGAFIAVADDATAASWNPGGLTQLGKTEISLVLSEVRRKESIAFGTNPEGSGAHRISEDNINYFSVSYPFELFSHNMVVSLNYQRLYDFTRDWEFTLKENLPQILSSQEHWDYQQKGCLSAIGLAYCIRIFPQLSAGFTLNVWDDKLSHNSWEQKYRMTGFGNLSGELGDDSFSKELASDESYSFRGINFNLGILWRISYRLIIGAVVKTPFTADVRHSIREHSRLESAFIPSDMKSAYHVRDEEMDMPMSYGFGLVYNFSDNFSMSADIYRTEWDDYIYRDQDGNEASPVSGRPADESDVKSTHQIRFGAEYRLINEEKGYLVPIRCGVFYDPAPAEGNPDDFYGFSLGLGFTKNDRFSLDIAYQYRFGNDVGQSVLEELQFSQDVCEHMIYLSAILYHF